jgi:APA family basic amino acid/polyamine antiporter
MVIIFAFILIGATYINFDNWKPFIPENTGVSGEFGLSGIVSGAGVIFLAFTGFDAVAATAQETKNPQRDLPIGILGSLFICTAIYILVSAVLTGIVHYPELAVAEPMAVAVNAMNMPWFSVAIKIGAIAGLTSVILVLMYAVVRVMFTVTHDGLLPMWLAKCHKKYHTPHIITFFVVMSMALLSALFPVDKLSKLANFGTLSTFSIVCFIVLYLRYKEPELIRGFECPLMPWVPIAGIIIFTVIIFSLPVEVLFYAGLWLGFLLIVYFVYGQHNSKLQKELAESGELELEQEERA